MTVIHQHDEVRQILPCLGAVAVGHFEAEVVVLHIKERSPDKALTERKKCLVKLAGDGMIPAEVLNDLPSPEEIARRAEEAAAKAKAALDANESAD